MVRNRITSRREITFLGIAKEEITEPMILLLLAVGVFYTILGNIGDALTLYAIIATLVFVEIANEYRAKKAISSLARLAEPKTRVVRDGTIREVASEEVVPGDLLVFVSGTRVAADGKIVSAVSLQVDESSLTGESFPREKVAGDEVSAGTLVVAGEGMMQAVSTGGATRVGKLSAQARGDPAAEDTASAGDEGAGENAGLCGIVFLDCYSRYRFFAGTAPPPDVPYRPCACVCNHTRRNSRSSLR